MDSASECSPPVGSWGHAGPGPLQCHGRRSARRTEGSRLRSHQVGPDRVVPGAAMAQPATTSQLPMLGGTGLVSHIYEYLWTKNNLLQTRCMYHKCPPVLIPDTVLLKNKQPTSWYFSSLKTGSLQRRSKDLSTSKVTEALVRRQDPNTDIVAAFVGSAQGKTVSRARAPRCTRARTRTTVSCVLAYSGLRPRPRARCCLGLR